MKKTVLSSRVLAFILTLAMLVSFAGAIPVITASATDPSFDGFLYNGDFETGTKSPWTFNSTSSIVEGGHNGSGYALRFTGGAWSKVKQTITVEPNRTHIRSIAAVRTAHPVFFTISVFPPYSFLSLSAGSVNENATPFS